MGLLKKSGNGHAPTPTAEDEVEALRAVLAHYPPGVNLKVGERSRCPRCSQEALLGQPGRDGTASHRCDTCKLTWKITRHAIDTIQAEIDEGVAELERVRTRLAGSRTMQLLLVEDDPIEAKLLQEILAPVLPDVIELFHTDTLHQAILNAELGFDATLVDVNLPDSTGMATVTTFLANCPKMPVCFATGDPDTAAELRRSGIPVMAKYDLPNVVRKHHRGTAEIVDLLVDAIAAKQAEAVGT